MGLSEKIMADLKTAMKAKDQVSLRGIRAIKSELILLKTSGSDVEITEDMEIKMLQKLVKQRKDSLTVYQEQGRDDLAKTELEEIDIIQRYLPEQMSAEDLKAYLEGVVAKVGASSMKDMGKVIGIASKELSGKAEGKAIANTVKSILSA